MSDAVIEVGEKVHIVMRRHFKEDIRRHFAGTVTAASLGLIRAQGFTFICSPVGLECRRLPGLRIRLFGLQDSGYIVNVLPPDVAVERLHYEAKGGALVLMDGAGYSLEVNEQN
jgi:hypothetical protein